MSGLESARDAMEAKLSGETAPSQDSTNQSSALAPERGDQQSQAVAIAELDKMDKFKLDGQEWTLKDLKSAILRQKDYTQKTQSLAEERKSFESNKKYYEHLAWDLQTLKENPRLIHEFIKQYPEEFHKYAEQIVNSAGTQNMNNQGANQQSVQRPQVDVQTLSRLEKLEKVYNDQEVSKAEREIESVVDKFSKQYENAGNFREMVLSRAYELHMRGEKLTDETWETIFKQVDDQVSTLLKAKYGNMVQKQKEANRKATDIGAGGGTAGTPKKAYKRLSDVTNDVVETLSGQRGR